MASIGDLIGSGRSADIYEFGPGRVLRRGRTGPIPASEPAVMEAVRKAGYPAPQVYDVDGNDMVMDRVDGVDLLTRLSRRPWEVARIGGMLAELHVRLAEIPIGDSAVRTKLGAPEVFVHGDLHPGNVLLTGAGPVVIDWEGSSLGPHDADVATTWLLLAVAEADDMPRLIRPFVGVVRRILLRSFLREVPRPRRETIAAVCDARLADANMRPTEMERIRAFAAEHA